MASYNRLGGPATRLFQNLINDVHLVSLRAALIDGGTIELTDPEESEDYGISWTDPAL